MPKYTAPWEKTKRQYQAFREVGVNWTNTTSGPGYWGKRKWRQRSAELHRGSVEGALARRLPVPAKVLREYPDIRLLRR